MNVIEAQDLALEIRLAVPGRVEYRQIGNGEWVVLINSYYFVWSPAEWERVKYAPI